MASIPFDLRGMNLYLIGMMGSGKSTLGTLLAQQLSYQFVDTDQVITQVTQRNISQIFADSGEPEFRHIETQVLTQLAAHTRLVVGTGGGIVLERLNWSHLHQGLVVWLDVPVDVLWQRLQGDTERPLLQDPNPQQKLKHLLQQRQALYAQADVQVTIGAEDSPDTVVEQILEKIPSVLKSGQPVPPESF